MTRRALLAAALVAAAAPATAAPPSLSFVVLGHVRGDRDGEPNPLLPELLAEVRALAPDHVFLTGDMIWGDVHSATPDLEAVRADWDHLDRALATLGAPVHRVPGNHDFSDPGTRDLYFERYGRPPRAVDDGAVRFLLLNSTWVPPGSEPPPLERPFVRGKPLGPEQIAFVRDALGRDPAPEHVFVFMHHMLWWEPDAAWWRELHPLLAAAPVRAVFAGDYGPMKFSHLQRDGVDYYQASIDGAPSVDMQRALVSARLLAQQFDCFLHVVVDGPDVAVDVRTLGETALGKFSPELWHAVEAPAPPPPRGPLWQRAWERVGTPRRLLALGALVAVSFAAGFAAARWRRGADRGRAPAGRREDDSR